MCNPCGCCSPGPLKSAVIAFSVLHWVCAGVLLASSLLFYLDQYVLIYPDVYDTGPASLWGASLLCIMIAGALAFIAGLLGVIGAAINNKPLLLSLVIISCLALGLEAAGGSLATVYSASLKSDDTMNSLLENLENATNLTPWDDLQTENQCCGINGYTDWEGNSMFDTLNITSATPVPSSCCVTEMISNATMDYDLCYDEAMDGNGTSDFLYTKGCLEDNSAWVDDRVVVIWIIAASSIVIQMIGVILAEFLRQMEGDNKVGQTPL